MINTNYALSTWLEVECWCKCLCARIDTRDTYICVRAVGRHCTSGAFSRFIPIRSLITWRGESDADETQPRLRETTRNCPNILFDVNDATDPAPSLSGRALSYCCRVLSPILLPVTNYRTNRERDQLFSRSIKHGLGTWQKKPRELPGASA